MKLPRSDADTANLTICSLNVCYFAGDNRVNEHPGLITMHTLWMREHNRIAREIYHLTKGSISDDEIFQMTRSIVVSEIQKISYKDFLPILLGDKYDELVPPYDGYKPQVDPTIPNSFIAAAFRFGHSMVRPSFDVMNEHYHIMESLQLEENFFNITGFEGIQNIDSILRGLSENRAALVDEYVNTVLANKLFAANGHAGLDLISLDIMRGRDHGLPPYLVWKEWVIRRCGIESAIRDKVTMIKLLDVYMNLNNVDLYVGGLAEEHVPGGLVGAVFACIIANTFEALRDGDRFYYENTEVHNNDPDIIKEIDKTSLALVICENTNIDDIQVDVFKHSNTKERCSDIRSKQSMNLTVWTNAVNLKSKAVQDYSDVMGSMQNILKLLKVKRRKKLSKALVSLIQNNIESNGDVTAASGDGSTFGSDGSIPGEDTENGDVEEPTENESNEEFTEIVYTGIPTEYNTIWKFLEQFKGENTEWPFIDTNFNSIVCDNTGEEGPTEDECDSHILDLVEKLKGVNTAWPPSWNSIVGDNNEEPIKSDGPNGDECDSRILNLIQKLLSFMGANIPSPLKGVNRAWPPSWNSIVGDNNEEPTEYHGPNGDESDSHIPNLLQKLLSFMGANIPRPLKGVNTAWPPSWNSIVGDNNEEPTEHHGPNGDESDSRIPNLLQRLLSFMGANIQKPLKGVNTAWPPSWNSIVGDNNEEPTESHGPNGDECDSRILNMGANIPRPLKGVNTAWPPSWNSIVGDNNEEPTESRGPNGDECDSRRILNLLQKLLQPFMGVNTPWPHSNNGLNSILGDEEPLNGNECNIRILHLMKKLFKGANTPWPRSDKIWDLILGGGTDRGSFEPVEFHVPNGNEHDILNSLLQLLKGERPYNTIPDANTDTGNVEEPTENGNDRNVEEHTEPHVPNRDQHVIRILCCFKKLYNGRSTTWPPVLSNNTKQGSVEKPTENGNTITDRGESTENENAGVPTGLPTVDHGETGHTEIPTVASTVKVNKRIILKYLRRLLQQLLAKNTARLDRESQIQNKKWLGILHYLWRLLSNTNQDNGIVNPTNTNQGNIGQPEYTTTGIPTGGPEERSQIQKKKWLGILHYLWRLLSNMNQGNGIVNPTNTNRGNIRQPEYTTTGIPTEGPEERDLKSQIQNKKWLGILYYLWRLLSNTNQGNGIVNPTNTNQGNIGQPEYTTTGIPTEGPEERDLKSQIRQKKWLGILYYLWRLLSNTNQGNGIVNPTENSNTNQGNIGQPEYTTGIPTEAPEDKLEIQLEKLLKKLKN